MHIAKSAAWLIAWKQHDGYRRALFGGAGYTSQITPIPNGWTAVEFTGINDSDYMIGQGMISGHPTAVAAFN